MEFKIPIEELQFIIARLSNIVRINEDDNTGMIMVEAGDGVKFRATDGSVHLIITNDKCEVIKPGKFLVKLRTIKGYVSKFVPLVDSYGTKDFHFIVEGPEGLIKTKTYFQSNKPAYRRLRFEPIYESDYPPVKPFGEAHLIINSNILKRGINKVMHCVNPGEIRRSMQGLHVIIKEDGIVFVGTNGVKLTEFELAINADIEKTSYIFTYNLAYILRAILEDDAQVFMRLEGRHAYIKSNDVYIVGSLILNEDYPNYKPMFELQKVITFPRLDFSDTVHTFLGVLDQEDNSRLTIKFNDNRLLFNNDTVESIQDFDAPFETNLDIDVNGDFLDSLLKDFISDKLEIHFTEGNNYVTFKDAESDKHTALLTILKRR